MFNQNVDALIDALTNVDNPAFDITKSSKMLGEYLQQNTKKRYDYNYGIAVKSSTANSTKTYYVNKQYLDASQFADAYGDAVKLIDEPVEGMALSANGFNFEYRNGQRYTEDENGDYTVKLTARQVASRTGLLNYTNTTAATLENIVLEEEEKAEVNVENSEDFAFNARPSKILETWKSRYKDMGFKFVSSGTMGSTITITADNGEKLVTRVGSVRGNRSDQAKELNNFIDKNKI